MGMFQTCINQIQSLKNTWKAIQPSMPDSFVHNGITVACSSIENSIEEIYRLLNIAEQQENPDTVMLSIHFPGVQSQCQQLAQQAAQLQSNPTAYLPAIINSLWGLKSSLLWVIPAGSSLLESWPARSGEIEVSLNSITDTYTTVNNQLGLIKSLQSELDLILSSLPKAKDLSVEVQKVLQDFSNAKISAEGSASNAAAKNEEADTYTRTLKKIVEVENELILYFEGKKSEVESTLEGASKVALAIAFSRRQNSHKEGKEFWRNSFYTGIVVMVALEVGISYVPGFPLLSSDTWLIWFISRLTTASPVIWFTWFAALQYSRTMRLEEDYAFKSAAAQSFYGYRREVGADEELLKLLQETAIKNFGSNPTRVLGSNDHGSPGQEFLQKLFSKTGIGKDSNEKPH